MIYYIYIGNPENYDADNDYDAMLMFDVSECDSEGVYMGFEDVENLRPDDKIYVFDMSLNIPEQHILKHLHKARVCFKKDFIKNYNISNINVNTRS